MICESCGKNDATIHYSQVVNNKATEFHLCESCAEKKGVMGVSPVAIGNLIAGLVGNGETEIEDRKVKEVCDKCGMTDVDFRRIGYLGCPECYKTFKKHLSVLLRRIHGNNMHIGKIPSKVPTKTGEIVKDDTELRKLRVELQKAVETEKFEEAAKLRDRIRELENNNKTAVNSDKTQ
jgi:protein arginine kinase activator